VVAVVEIRKSRTASQVEMALLVQVEVAKETFLDQEQ
jgi:hypothetical protein